MGVYTLVLPLFHSLWIANQRDRVLITINSAVHNFCTSQKAFTSHNTSAHNTRGGELSATSLKPNEA